MGCIGVLAPIPFLSIFLTLCIFDFFAGILRVIVKKQKLMAEAIWRMFGRIFITMITFQILSQLSSLNQIWGIIPNTFVTLGCFAMAISAVKNLCIVAVCWKIDSTLLRFMLRIIETQQENIEKNLEKTFCGKSAEVKDDVKVN
jgi:phage-related holin